MTTKDLAPPRLRGARAHRADLEVTRPRLIDLAAGALMSVCAVGSAWPAFGQDANRLGTCLLDPSTVTALQNDVADGVDGIAGDDVEIAFVVVYSLNNDNNGQPLDGLATGPVLCADAAVTGIPAETAADDPIPPVGTVDIRDSSEAFLLRYEESDTTEAETRFCHTTNANVDCFLLGPTLLD